MHPSQTKSFSESHKVGSISARLLLVALLRVRQKPTTHGLGLTKPAVGMSHCLVQRVPFASHRYVGRETLVHRAVLGVE